MADFDYGVPGEEPKVVPIRPVEEFDYGVPDNNVRDVQKEAKQSLEIASQKDPSQQTDVFSIAEETGVSPELVDKDLSGFQKKRELFKVDLSQHPITAEYFSNPKNALMSSDDVENMKAMEDAMNNYRAPVIKNERVGALDYLRAFPSGAIQGVGMGFSGLGAAVDAATRMTARGLDVILPESADKYLYKQDDTPEALKKVNEVLSYITPSTFLNWEGEGLEKNAEDLAPKNTNLGTQVMSGLGQLTGQALMTIVNPESAVAMMGGMGVEMQAEKQRATNTLGSSTTSDLALFTGGAITAASEKTGIDKMLERIPPKIKNEIGNYVTDVLIAGGIEAVQEMSENIAHNILEKITTNSEADITEGAVEEGVVASLVGMIFRGSIRAPEVVGDRKLRALKKKDADATNTLESLNTQGQIDNMITLAQSSNVNGRNAKAYKAFIEQNGDEDIIISSQGIEAAIAEGIQFPDYIESQADGFQTDVTISVSDFLSDIATNEELLAVVRPHIKKTLEEYTAAELKEGKSDLVVEELVARAAKEEELHKETTAIFEQIKDQLTTTGRQSEETARISAQLYPAFVTTYVSRAKDHGAKTGQDTSHITPEWVFKNKMGLTIVGPSVDVDGSSDTMTQAKEQGYEGEDIIGADEWIRAKEKGLDMSQEARMERAKEMGFDVDQVVYHGTATDFKEFDPDRAIGTQFWSTTNKAAVEAGDVGAQGSGVIKEMYTNIKNPAGWKEYENLGIDEIISRGYDGVALQEDDGITYIAFKPEQYRSTNAAFDPDYAASPNLLAQSAYHGTPHKFDKFSLDAMGTGEGAQAYGWGIYLAGRKSVAEFYQRTLAGEEITINGKPLDEYNKVERDIVNAVISNGRNFDDMQSEAEGVLSRSVESLSKLSDTDSRRKKLESLISESKERIEAISSIRDADIKHEVKGNLFQVDIPEDSELLDYDKPLSEQSDFVKDKAIEAYKNTQKPLSNDDKKLLDDLLGDATQDELEMIESAPDIEDSITGAALYQIIQSGFSQQDKWAMDWSKEQGYDVYGGDFGAMGSDHLASEYLNSLGIKGLRYLDGESRNRPYKEVVKEFRNELPDSAEFEDVTELFDTGAFSDKNESLLKALEQDDWLGFDYPAQAISAVLGNNFSDFDPSPELMQARYDALEGGTHNYVIWDEDAVTVEAVNDEMVEADRQEERLFQGGDVDTETEDLVVTHNLSEENLKHAIKLGGLAAPSLAVQSASKGFGSFGEISLLADPALINDKTIPFFDSDIYSPRQPRATYDIDYKKFNAFMDEVNAITDNIDLRKTNILELEDRGVDEILRSDAVQYAWLKEQGIAPNTKKLKPGANLKKGIKAAEKYDYRVSFFELAKDEKLIAIKKQELKDLAKEIDVDESEFLEGGEPSQSSMYDFARLILSHKAKEGIDTSSLRDDVNKKMRVKKNSDAFEKWAQDKFDGMVDKEVMFAGTDNQGRKKFKPYTLDNIVKNMVKELQGGEGFHYGGAGHVRSAVAKKLSSVNAAKKSRGKMASKEEMEVIKEESDAKHSDVLESLKKYYKFDSKGWGYSNDAEQTIMDYALGKGRLSESFESDPEVKQIVDEHLRYLSSLPTEYFEGKARRAMDFSEFNIAVVPKGVSKETIQSLKDSGLTIKKYDPKIDGDRERVISQQSKVLFQQPTSPLAEIYLKDNGERIIKLLSASDLSSFLHESGHLFLEMEKDFAKEFGLTEDQQTMLDWMGVESMDDIGVEQHEKFAETFEVYLMTGKAPSLALRDVFSRFKSWLTQIYTTLNSLKAKDRLSRADLNPEISAVMDRLLATQAEIDEATANPAYDQFFRSQEQSGKSDAEWAKYLESIEKRKNRATESIDKKLMDEWISRKTKEWEAERKEIQAEEIKRLELEPVYQVIQSLRQTPIDREGAREAMGLPAKLTAKEQHNKRKLISSDDSILVLAAKGGGLDYEAWKGELKDVTQMKGMPVVGMPLFKKSGGMTPGQFVELAGEWNFGENMYDSQVVDMVQDELDGVKQYSPEGAEVQAEIEYNREHDITPVIELTPEQALEKQLNKITSASKGYPADLYAEEAGYDTPADMIQAVLDAKPLKQQAFENAEADMISRYGDILNDGSLINEVREAVHSDEQAKVLLDELKALGRKVGSKEKINRKYLEAQAKTMIEGMTFAEIKPNKYYMAEIRSAGNAAKALVNAKNATTKEEKVKFEKEAFDYKAQQIANHYLYREARDWKDKSTRIRKYVRGMQDREYDARKVDSEYLAQMKVISRIYDFKGRDAKKDSMKELRDYLTWHNTQIENNPHIDFTIHSENLLLALEAMKAGTLESYNIKHFDQFNMSELQGLYDQLRHLRHIGGKVSDFEKISIKKRSEDLNESIEKKGGKDKPAHSPGMKLDKDKTKIERSEAFNWLVNLRGMTRKLDGFKQEDQKAFQEIYIPIRDAANKKLDLSSKIYEQFKAELYELENIGLSKKPVDFTLEDGRIVKANEQHIFQLGMYMGNQSSRDMIAQGQGYTHNDMMNIVGTLSTDKLKMLNSFWKINESLWPELATASVARTGVAPPKLDAMPFVVNGVELTGGHMRLFYEHAKSEMKQAEEQNIDMNSMLPSKTGSLYARIGGGGKNVSFEIDNISRALDESIHYIAYSGLTDLQSLVNSDGFMETVIRKHGEGFYKALISQINLEVSGRKARESAPRLAIKFGGLLKQAATAKYLMFSIRNTVQAIGTLPAISEEIGTMAFGNAVIDIANNPEKIALINEMSVEMRERSKVVNREASENVRQIKVLSNNKLAVGYEWAKSNGFVFQIAVDSLMAYPVWQAKFDIERERILNSSESTPQELKDVEKLAIIAADEAVAITVGSGLDLHLSQLFHSKQGMLLKLFTQFGSWFNNYFQRVYKNTGGLDGQYMWDHKKQTIATLWVVPSASAILSALAIMDYPEDDEDLLSWYAKIYGSFMSGFVPVGRDFVGAAISGFTPTTVIGGAAKTGIDMWKDVESYVEGRQSGLKTASDITLKGVATFVPMPGAGQISRPIDFIESYNKGKEDGNPVGLFWQGVVEGTNKN